MYQQMSDLPRFAVQGGRLVWPWAAVFALSGVLAFGVDQSLLHAPTEQTEPPARAHTRPSSTWVVEFPRDESNTKWITLMSVDGMSVDCISSSETFATDAVVLEPADFNYITAQLRCYSLADR